MTLTDDGTDRLVASPTTVDLGAFTVGTEVAGVLTLSNNTGRQVFADLTWTTDLDLVEIRGCGDVIGSGRAELYLDVDATCELVVSIATALVGPSLNVLTFVDPDVGDDALVEVTAEITDVEPPANDDWANAEDLSSSAIPPFVGIPGPFPPAQLPRDTVAVSGTAESATVEPGEAEWWGSDSGSVWYRFTSPPGGFAGRLGYRVTPGFFVSAYTNLESAVPDDLQNAKGNTWGPSSLSHVRMEPGHTVWFRVVADEDRGVAAGPLVLELFQAPNEQDSIVNANALTGAGEFALAERLDGFGDGDTYHTTPDASEGPPNNWRTLRVGVAGALTITLRSSTAFNVPGGFWPFDQGSERPVGLRLFRSPTATRISDPALLGPPIAVGTTMIRQSGPPGVFDPVAGTRAETTISVDVVPGRYYWSIDEGPDGPTFFVDQTSFNPSSSPVDTTPPVITISRIEPGATVTEAEPSVTISSTEPLFAAICILDTPLPGGRSDSNEIGCLADGDSAGTLTLPELPDGQVTLTVFGQDAAGNRTQVSVTFFVEVPPTASISAPADGVTYAPADVPTSVVYRCTDNSEIVLEEVQLVPQGGGTPTLLVGPPPSSIGTHTIRVLCVDGLGEEAIASATYVVEADGSGPCVLVETPTVDFGDITVGSTSPDRSVVVRSCSTAPITVAASVGDATTVGGGEIWLATTSTIPAANQFSWTITPAGGSTPVPVGPTRTTIGPVLAPGTTRSDAHRLRLGPAGPGLGTQFTSIVTYTAFAADP